MHSVIRAENCCPDETLPWKRDIRDNVRRFPLLTRLGESAAIVRAKSDDGRRQIGGRKNLVEARGILQNLALRCWQLRDIRKAKALNHYREKKVKADALHSVEWSNVSG